MLWIKEVEMVDPVDSLNASQSVGGHRFPIFELLDEKIASLLKRITSNPFFQRRVSLEDQKAQTQDRCLRGRQILYIIYEHFQVTGAHDAVLDLTDLVSVSLQGDIQGFDTRWYQALLSTSEMAKDHVS